MREHARARPLRAAALALAAIVYLPITRSYFHSDDFVNLQQIVNYPLLRYLLTPFGGHVLVVRNAIFHLSYDVFGPRPAPFFCTVLATHLVNVALVFEVIRLTTGSPWLACFGAVMWGTCPADVGSLGWYAVYGHVLVATVTGVVLWRLVRHLARGTTISAGEALVLAGVLVAGALSFGVGVAVALAFPVVALLARPRASRAAWVVLLAPAVIVPVVYRSAFWVAEQAWGMSPVGRIVMFALARSWTNDAGMIGHLLGYGVVALVGGFWAPPQAYPAPRRRSGSRSSRSPPPAGSQPSCGRRAASRADSCSASRSWRSRSTPRSPPGAGR